MFGFSTIEYLFDCHVNRKNDEKSLISTSEVFSSLEIICYSLEEYEKFLLMSIYLKSQWVYEGLKFTTYYVDLEISHPLIDEVVLQTLSDIKFVLKFLHNIEITFPNINSENIQALKNELDIIKKVIYEGSSNSWEYFLNNLIQLLNGLFKDFKKFKKPLLLRLSNSLTDKSIINNTDNNLSAFKRFKSVTELRTAPVSDMQWFDKVVKDSGLEDLYKTQLYFKKSDVSGVETTSTKNIQESFANSYNYAKKMKDGTVVLAKYIEMYSKNISEIESKTQNDDINNSDKCFITSKINEVVKPCFVSIQDISPIKVVEENKREQKTDANVNEPNSLNSNVINDPIEENDTKINPETQRDDKCSIISKDNEFIGPHFVSIQDKTPMKVMEQNKNVQNSDSNVKINNNLINPNILDDSLEDISLELKPDISNFTSKKRTAWSMNESYLIYKGVQQKLSWATIRDAYFQGSKRTNVQIKDRWRFLISKPNLMSELEHLHKSKHSLKK